MDNVLRPSSLFLLVKGTDPVFAGFNPRFSSLHYPSTIFNCLLRHQSLIRHQTSTSKHFNFSVSIFYCNESPNTVYFHPSSFPIFLFYRRQHHHPTMFSLSIFIPNLLLIYISAKAVVDFYSRSSSLVRRHAYFGGPLLLLQLTILQS